MEEGDKLHYLNTALLPGKIKKTMFLTWLFNVLSLAVHTKFLSLAIYLFIAKYFDGQI